MYARLSYVFGWRWKDSDGVYSYFVLENVYRYAGMICGTAQNGRLATRPLHEFDALSIDGDEWKPLNELLALVPWENQNVRESSLHLPGDRGQSEIDDAGSIR